MYEIMAHPLFVVLFLCSMRWKVCIIIPDGVFHTLFLFVPLFIVVLASIEYGCSDKRESFKTQKVNSNTSWIRFQDKQE